MVNRSPWDCDYCAPEPVEADDDGVVLDWFGAIEFLARAGQRRHRILLDVDQVLRERELRLSSNT